MPENPYQPPQEVTDSQEMISRRRWMLILIPGLAIGGLFVSCIGGVITHFICVDLAISEAYRRDPGGYYDEDEISGDELPALLWYSPIVVFFAIACFFALIGYSVFRASEERRRN